MKKRIIKVIPINSYEVDTENVIIMNLNLLLHQLGVSIKKNNPIEVKTRLFKLNACKKIDMIQLIYDQQTRNKLYNTTNFLNSYVRVYTDTNSYHYNGTSWVVDNTNTLWNTEQEVTENISSFILPASKKVGFYVKVTKGSGFQLTDKMQLQSIKILCDCDLNHTEDYLYKTMVHKLETECFGQSRFMIGDFKGDRFNLKSYIEEQKRPYKNYTPVAVYDVINDPQEIDNLFYEYENNTCRLNKNIFDKTRIVVYFKYNPTAQVTKSADYYELASYPTLTIFNYQEMDVFYGNSKYGADIFNNHNGEGFVSYEARLVNLNFQILIDTESNYDFLYLKEGLQKFLKENILLTTWGLDEQVDLCVQANLNDSTVPNMSDIRHGIIKVEIKNAVYYDQDVYAENPIKQINFTVE